MRFVVYVLNAPYLDHPLSLERAFLGADSLKGYSPAVGNRNTAEIKHEFEKTVN